MGGSAWRKRSSMASRGLLNFQLAPVGLTAKAGAKKSGDFDLQESFNERGIKLCSRGGFNLAQSQFRRLRGPVRAL